MTTHSFHWGRRPVTEGSGGGKLYWPGARRQKVNNSTNQHEIDAPEYNTKAGATTSSRLQPRRLAAASALAAVMGTGAYVVWPHLAASESLPKSTVSKGDDVRYALPSFDSCASLVPTEDVAATAMAVSGNVACDPTAQLSPGVKAVARWALADGGTFVMAFAEKAATGSNPHGTVDGGWANLRRLDAATVPGATVTRFTLDTLAGKVEGVAVSNLTRHSSEVVAQVGDTQFSWGVADAPDWAVNQVVYVPIVDALALDLANQLGPVPQFQTPQDGGR